MINKFSLASLNMFNYILYFHDFFLTFIQLYCLKKANMDANNINYNEEVLKGGLIVAGVSILILMVTYIVNVEMMVEWWYGLISLAISIGLTIYIE